MPTMGTVDTLGSAMPPARPHSRSERRILLYRAQALSDGPLYVLGLDVAPSTLLPFYDEDTSVVFLTGKVRWSLPASTGLPTQGTMLRGPRALTPAPIPLSQGDTRVFLYEVTPEPPYFLECNSFTSSDPHKVRGCLPGLCCLPCSQPRSHICSTRALSSCARQRATCGRWSSPGRCGWGRAASSRWLSVCRVSR